MSYYSSLSAAKSQNPHDHEIQICYTQVKINHIDIPMGDIEKNESTYADSSIGEGMDITIQVVMMITIMMMMMMTVMIEEGMKH